MAEKVYIELDEIVDAINARRDSAAARKDLRTMHELNCLMDVIKDRDCIPAADVAPVVHSKNETEMNPVDEFICSECGFVSRDMSGFYIEEDCCYEFNPHYCPNCGAKMDKEESEDDVR